MISLLLLFILMWSSKVAVRLALGVPLEGDTISFAGVSVSCNRALDDAGVLTSAETDGRAPAASAAGPHPTWPEVWIGDDRAPAALAAGPHTTISR